MNSSFNLCECRERWKGRLSLCVDRSQSDDVSTPREEDFVQSDSNSCYFPIVAPMNHHAEAIIYEEGSQCHRIIPQPWQKIECASQ